METQEPTLVGLMRGDNLPHLNALSEQEFDFDLDRLFEFGLARLLDGIAVLLKSG
jgi:Tetracyclin repressor-like, C-terminal domain